MRAGSAVAWGQEKPVASWRPTGSSVHSIPVHSLTSPPTPKPQTILKQIPDITYHVTDKHFSVYLQKTGIFKIPIIK